MALVPITIYGNIFTNAETIFLEALADHSYTNGQLIIGNSSTGGVSFSTLIAGTNVTITNGPGTITIAASGSGSFVGSQEVSTTTPNGSQQTFAFTHAPKIIFWNGSLLTLTTDYTVSSLTITFTGTQVPQTGDKIINIYA